MCVFVNNGHKYILGNQYILRAHGLLGGGRHVAARLGAGLGTRVP